MADTSASKRQPGRITFHHPAAFWSGAAAITAGVLLMLPFYFSARNDHYHLAGKSIDAAMTIGMILALIGIGACAYGLFPRLSDVSMGYVSRIRVRALDDAPLRPSHIALLL